MHVKYEFPQGLRLSSECLDLMNHIFVANPSQRYTIEQVKKHPWYVRNLPLELQTGYKDMKLFPQAQQTKEELLDILEMARTVGTPGVAPRKPNIVRGTGPSVMPAPTQTVQKQQQQAQQPVIQQKQQSVVSGTNGKPKNPWRRVP
eukprot:TRINITY_DN7114_c0_g2_i2.p2 TRINITY_DN7114_c0_g2~~TRINITY_DN7114_c0_g2_i2.p2  ORF type:complete len:146 (-),score=21.26 TRINITY_DN7114_c0_g2_i2:550-987(-)